jgi:hypothetical protein
VATTPIGLIRSKPTAISNTRKKSSRMIMIICKRHPFFNTDEQQ